MVTSGGANFSVMAASPKTLARWDRRESAAPITLRARQDINAGGHRVTVDSNAPKVAELLSVRCNDGILMQAAGRAVSESRH
jgi:hypothetical protein